MAVSFYDSSEFTAMRLARSRSASVSSTSSVYDDSSSSSSSSLASLESSEIEDIFKQIDNVIISPKTLDQPPRTSTIQLDFRSVHAAFRNRRRPSLSSDDKLNPQAAAFVPRMQSSQLAQSSSLPPSYEESEARSTVVPPGLPIPAGSSTSQAPHTDRSTVSQAESFDAYYEAAPPPPTHWSLYFDAGTSHDAIADDYIRESNATAAVASNANWSDEELLFFASHFPGRVYSSTLSSEYPVAAFAFSVYQAFESTHGVMAGQRFLFALRQHSIHAFMQAWSKDSLKPELHTHLETGLSGHISASLYLAKFIGDLFNVGLLSKDHVKSCISKLLEGPVSEEHIVALGHLIIQAGAEFWMSEPMVLDVKEFEEFMVDFENAATYARDSLIEYNEQPTGYSARWVDHVKEHFFSWEATMADYS